MKRLCIMIVFAFAGYAASAQNTTNSYSYKTALGVKVLDGAGITLKSFINGNNALEGVGFFWRQGFRLTGLYEIHGNINGAPGLKWYVGPGAHVGVYNKDYYGGATTFGIDGVLGLDYKIKGAPINFSLDWQPSFEFSNNRGFVGSWGGFAVRYTF
ncbi:hypothetical protein [Sediminibacterium soli]|uniref:hypothetical protein n=1 Tax=Sediminibacterium soli TaxID=2698829 RepID=UPI00137B00CD|nr:hypothetical protein [Sediminibacterium soli]NCI45904.1 hypothetical protein [Sediminibacterium soli]